MKSVRKRFILFTMLSAFIVITIMMLVINFINYNNVDGFADTVTQTLADNGGKFNEPEFMPGMRDRAPFEQQMNRETPFETRYFTVKYQGESIETNITRIASIDSATAIEMANAVKDKSTGYTGVFRYRVSEIENGKLVIFLDCTQRLSQANAFLINSLIISAIALVGIFVVVFFISKRAVKPIIMAYEKQKRFISNSAHELKTPLTIISANNEMIEITSGENELTDGINKQIKRLSTMVRNLTLLTKIDDIKDIMNKTFSATDALNDVLTTYKSIVEEKKLALDLNIDEEVYLTGDEELFKQLLSVLLDNAYKYAKTFIRVELLKDNDFVLRIINDANKVEEGNLDRCFERFYRFDSTRAEGIEGSGIGLSIAKEIVDLHKGKIIATGLPNNVFEIKVMMK